MEEYEEYRVMKKILGYGFKLTGESIENALLNYSGDYLPSRKEVEAEIKEAFENGYIGKNAKPKIFKVLVQVE